MQYILAVPYIVWLIISALFVALGEYFSKEFGLSPSIRLAIIILVVDIVSTLTWLPAIYEKNQLSVVGIIWSVLCLAVTFVIGVIVFGEKLTTLGMLGIFFAFISVVLLSLA